MRGLNPDGAPPRSDGERVALLRGALVASLDFIEHHPAVQGEWPVLVGLIRGALNA